MKKVALCMVVGSVVLAACSDARPRPPNADEIPESVSVGGGTFTTGFASGRIRKAIEVDAYRIGKTLVTVGRFKQCIAAGACTPPSLAGGECAKKATARQFGATFEIADELPITCITPEQASAYCGWVGGGLPTESQWLDAARGKVPQRFPWGDQPPTCAQHSGATDGVKACATTVIDLRVGQHPGAASTGGMQDVLLTPGELLASSSDATFGACQGHGACEVQSISPGEISGLMTVDRSMKELPAWSRVYGFRCAWEGGGR